jgi:hypothetical protein
MQPALSGVGIKRGCRQYHIAVYIGEVFNLATWRFLSWSPSLMSVNINFLFMHEGGNWG